MKTRIKPNWIIGSLFVLVFLLLLGLRLGLFQRDGTVRREDHASTSERRPDREAWMKISQQGQKIGYSHRQYLRTEKGQKIVESIFVQVNTMGMLQEIRVKTEGNFLNGRTLSSFDFEVKSSLFHFKARGVLKGKTLALLTSASGSEQKIEIPLKNEIHLPVDILEVLNDSDLKPGDSRTFDVFDPATMSERPVRMVMVSEETIPVLGRMVEAKKVSLDFMGVPQFAWVGGDGTVLREEGSLGIKLERVTREEALSEVHPFRGPDLTEMASIPSNRVIPNAGKLKEMRLRIEGRVDRDLFLDGGRQSLKGGVLTVKKESFSDSPSQKGLGGVSPDGRTYLESTPWIQADHPDIRAKAREIVSPGDSPLLKAKKLVNWINENIEKRPVLSVPNALETLRNRVGDCNEHAVLLAALARACGIPAEVEAGVVYQNGRFYYHAWNSLYLGSWVTADAVMGQLPADVTHIRFVRGPERQIDLIGIIGKVRLEILETF